MSSPRKNTRSKGIDLINEPKVIALASQTYSYGKTPTAICRQQFQEIAEALDLSLEELAKNVLEKSVQDQLCMLQDFYKSKNNETLTIYDQLIQPCFDEPLSKLPCVEKPPRNPTYKTPVKRKSDKATEVRMKRSNVLVSPISKGKPSKNACEIESLRKLEKKKMVAANTSLPRTELSSQETVATKEADNSMRKSIEENPPTVLNSTLGQGVADNIREQNKEPTTLPEPITVIQKGVQDQTVDTKSDGNLTSEDTSEDLDTFLYGKSPSRPRAPPKKKAQQVLLQLPVNTNEQPSDSPQFSAPESPRYSTPKLSFDSNSCSPSRQRDLLSVARDIADLQKAIAAGQKLSNQDSISDKILFTKD